MKKLIPKLSGAALVLALIGGTQDVRAVDSPTDNFINDNTSLLKIDSGTWTLTDPPTQGQTGVISEGASANPLGWNNNTNPGASTIGDLDFVSGATNLVIGNYTTKSANTAVNITLAGSTLNSQANTILANSSGNTIVFENDVAPAKDDLTETGLTTFTLGNSTNFIQGNATSKIIIDNVITGTNDSLTYLGGGTSSATGGVLELGAGSANDVTGGVAANAPVKANGGSFASTAIVQTADKNSFTGGLTIGSANGTQAGIVQIDGANALPTTGTVTVNTNSQLFLNGSATYGGTSQTIALNGAGTGGSNNGALITGTADTSTVQTTVSLATASAINAQGTSKLTLSGQVTGSGQLSSVGTGTLTLTHANNYSGGTTVSNGSFVADNTTALGTGHVTVAGGKLSSLLSTTTNIGALALNSGSIALNATALPTFSLASAQNFTMTGGTLSLTNVAGTVGSIGGLNSSFSITGGTLDLGNSFTGAAYSESYDILSGFSSGSVADLSIINYDTTHFTAEVSDSGVLTFNQVPEPSTYALLFGSIGFLGFLARRKAVRPDSMI